MKKVSNLRPRREGIGEDGRRIQRQYRIISKEILSDRARLAQLSALYGSDMMRAHGGGDACELVPDNPAGLPLGMPPIDELSRYFELIEDNYRRCAQLLGDMQEYINSIEDSETRRIFTLHYINGWSWQKVAFGVNGYDESYPRKKHDRYLKTHPFRPSAEVGRDARYGDGINESPDF